METTLLAGASNPGVPLVMIGRSNDISWGITAALADVADVYRETINESDDQYFVDNEWKDLKVISHDIPIKGKSPFKGANIYLTGQNLLTFTNYSGYDPEITSFLWTGLITGVDWNGPPNARNFLLGLNLNL